MPRRAALTLLALLAGGCQVFAPNPLPEGARSSTAAWPGLERADRFEGVTADAGVVGRVQVVLARDQDTFSDLARRFNLGYDELVAANPGVDPWLPGEGTAVVLPTAHVIPAGRREGVVVNVPAMRLWWFGPADEAGRQTIVTHPVGIGRVGWSTPIAETAVVDRTRNPTWYPPASVREEHAEAGDPLPAIVPPGPDNPLGDHAVRLALPGYLLHGTNKPWGVGMRVSHGCIRLYPEDIEALFPELVPGTKVRFVDQPWLAGRRDGEVYFEAHAPLEDGHREWTAGIDRLAEAAGDLPVDWVRAGAVAVGGRGIPFPVTAGTPGPDDWLAGAPAVENRARGNYGERLARVPADEAAAAGQGSAAP